VLDDSITVNITPNIFSVPETAQQIVNNADCISFTDFQAAGSLCANELQDGPTNLISADVDAKIGSLIPVDFSNPQGSGFITPGTSAVPEPRGMALAGLGFAVLAGVRITRRLRGERAGKPCQTRYSSTSS
jgi:hypothetical protein